MIKTIIFDFDGVICRTEKYHVDLKYQLFQEWGYPTEYEALVKTVGKNFEQSFPELYPDADVNYYTPIFKKALVENKPDYRDIFNDEIFILLDYCKANGIRCAIASNSLTQRNIENAELLGIKDYMDKIIGNDITSAKKPNPVFYQDVIKLLNANPLTTVVIEDSPTGIHAAKGAGLFTIAKRTEGLLSLDQSEADCIIDKLDEAINIIKAK